MQFFVTVAIAILYTTVNSESIGDRGRLIRHLFSVSDYDTWNYPDNITVQVGISLISLNAAKSYENNLGTNVLLRQVWFDPRLEWDPKDFGEQRMLSIPSGEVWKPDIKLLNTLIPPSVQTCGAAKVVISNNGQVSWVTPCQFESSCNFSTNAPGYDYNGVKNCSLNFGHWVEDGTSTDLQFYKNQPQVDLQLFQDLTQWEVIGSNATIIDKSSKGGHNEILPAQLKFEINFRQKQQVPPFGNFSPAAAGAAKSGPIDCGPGHKPSPEGTCIEGVKFD